MNRVNVCSAVLPLLHHSGMLSLLNKLSPGARRMVFLYHRVGPQHADWKLRSVASAAFDYQMAYLSTHFTVLPLGEVVQKIRDKEPLPRRLACVTFDDGYKDIYTHALPILEKYDIPATLFLTAGAIDKREAFWWDRASYCIMHPDVHDITIHDSTITLPDSPSKRIKLVKPILGRLRSLPFRETLETVSSIERQTGTSMPQPEREALTVTWDDVRALHERGVTIGVHTLSHPTLTHIPLEEAKTEISGARDLIQKRTGIAVNHFSYPHGHYKDFNEEIVSSVRDAGYDSACTIVPSKLNKNTDAYRIGRLLPEYHAHIFHAYTSGLVQSISVK